MAYALCTLDTPLTDEPGPILPPSHHLTRGFACFCGWICSRPLHTSLHLWPSELACDIEMQIRRERMSKREGAAGEYGQERQSRADDRPLVGNLIGEDRVIYVLRLLASAYL